MALIALTSAAHVRIEESIEQMTLPAAEAIPAGALVRLDVSSGKFTLGNGTSAPEARVYGIATGKGVAAGMPLTAVAKGVLDGWDFTAQAYDAAIYASDTDGRLGDAAGTVSKPVGRVIPGTSTLLGVAYDKFLRVEL